MSATGGTGDAPLYSLISVEEFRRGLEYFLLTFTVGGSEFPYKDKIRCLALHPFISHELDANLEALGTSNEEDNTSDMVQGSVLTLHLDNLRSRHWLPGIVHTREGMEVTDYDAVDHSDLRRACEGLYMALRTVPFKYLPVCEVVVRDVFVLLECSSKPKGDVETNLLEEALLKGVDRVCQSVPEALTLRAKLLPFQVEIIFYEKPLSLRELKSTQMEKLVVIPGIVIQASRPYLKAMTLIIQCKDCGHRRLLRIPNWKQGTALPRTCEGVGASSQQTSADKCSLDPFYIVAEDCNYIDVQTVKIQELPDDVPTGDIPRHLMLNVPNALVNRATPGSRLLICGVYSAYERNALSNSKTGALESSVRSGYLHVLGIQAINRETVRGLGADGGMTSIPRGLSLTAGAGFPPQEIEQFHRLASLPDIINQISASIAPSIYGIEDIKRSVACMLFGGSRKYLPDGSALRGDIHLLLLGDPSTAKSQVLKFVERSAPVAVYTSGKGSSAAGLTAALVRDNHGNYALEGGAMVLADGGVVCIDEFDKMRDDDRVAIHEAMEQQTISIAKAGINTVLTTQCAVIAAANPTFGCYDDTKDASDQHNFEATILSRFDCIWLVRDERNKEKDRILAQHIFSLYTSGSANPMGEGPIPLKLLRSYISYCRAHCHPRLSADAAKRLENFYVEVRESSRNDRRSRRDQIPITVRQLESLARLSESFAKMTLSSSATLAHVEEAIRLFRVSTVATAQSSMSQQILTPEDRELVKSTEEALLQRLAIGGRAAKTTIVRDLRLRGFEPPTIAKALAILIQRGVLEERGDATVRRVEMGH